MAVVVLTTAGQCYGCPPPTTPPATSQAGLYLIPPTLWVGKGETFTLRVRALDDAGVARPEDEVAGANWSSTLPSFPPTTGASVMVTAPNTGTFPQTFHINVALNPLTPATIAVHVTDGAAPATGDWVAAKHVDGEPPAIALVDGRTTLAIDDVVVPFVRMGALDYLECIAPNFYCGEVTLFSRIQAIHRVALLRLTGGCESVDFGGAATFPAGCIQTAPTVTDPRRVPVTKIYVLSTEVPASAGPVSPEGVAEMDLGYAQRVVADGWTGLVLTPVVEKVPGAEISITFGEDMSCTIGPKTVKQQLLDAGIPSVPDGQITVAYVGKLLDIDGIEVSGLNGATCPWEDRNGPGIVLISWAQWVPTTLAHELMHGIGPWNEHPWGHTNGIAGFNAQNILFEWEAPTTAAPRSQITLGQAFRLSLDSYSVFNRTSAAFPAPGTYLCQGIASLDETPCPRLNKDAVRP